MELLNLNLNINPNGLTHRMEVIGVDMGDALEKGSGKLFSSEKDVSYISMQNLIEVIEKRLERETSALKKENAELKKSNNNLNNEINKIKSQLLTTKKVNEMVDNRMGNMKDSYLRIKQLNYYLNIDKDFKAIVEEIKEFNKNNMTKKQAVKLSSKIDLLRRETSYLDRLSKEVEKHKNIENNLTTINKRVLYAEKRIDTLRKS